MTSNLRRLASALALGALASASPVRAAAAAGPEPITRILAIGTIMPGADIAKVRALLPAEVRATVELYLAGRVAEWYSRADRIGVVFLLDMRDMAGASALLASLPLGRAHLMEFELMPLGPLSPLRQLTGEAQRAR